MDTLLRLLLPLSDKIATTASALQMTAAMAASIYGLETVEYAKHLYANNSHRCCLTFAMVSVTTGPGRSHYGDENSSKERLRIGSGNPLAQVLAMKAFI